MKTTLKMSKETIKLLNEFDNLITEGERKYAAGLGADVLLGLAIHHAPIGPTHNLRNALFAATDKKGSKVDAHVWVNPKLAPHAHLVEYGTVERFTKKTGALRGTMPANSFMRKAVIKGRQKVLDVIESSIYARIMKKLKKYK